MLKKGLFTMSCKKMQKNVQTAPQKKQRKMAKSMEFKGINA